MLCSGQVQVPVASAQGQNSLSNTVSAGVIHTVSGVPRDNPNSFCYVAKMMSYSDGSYDVYKLNGNVQCTGILHFDKNVQNHSADSTLIGRFSV